MFLSGGLDSSTNAALFAEGESRPVRTFSIGYDRDYAGYANELHHARAMAERIGADHHERRLTRDDVIDFLPRMVHLQDEPIADPVCVPVYYVAKLAREHDTIVCQLGEGADELFIGYPELASGARASATGRSAGAAIHQGPAGHPRSRRRLRPRLAGTNTCAAARAASRCSGAAPNPSRMRTNGSCSVRVCASSFAALTSWDALAPIRADFLAKAHDHRISTG